MKILVTGAGGQLAWELEQSVPQGHQLVALSSAELDITDARAVTEVITREAPQAVINAAAYTAVDKAESEADVAHKVNATGAANLARACVDADCYLLQVSTDFVFDGEINRPYQPSDTPRPLSVYGSSKLAGEQALLDIMPAKRAIIRTSWVYSAHGGNFVKSMLRLMRDKPELKVVSDQVGTPTWAAGLAGVCWAAVAERLDGTYHWSDAGVASWYDFASVIQTLAVSRGLLRDEIPIAPIGTHDYPTPATRPRYSVLDKSSLLDALPSLRLVHWQRNLASMLAGL